uniref:Cas12f1-like TNB domain-containing protein n=1 Tax=Staphylothermus marinus TaxID=2280 RepID=A0A7J3KH56_STAMA
MKNQPGSLERTVVLVSPELTSRKLTALSYVYEAYGEILREALDYMYSKNVVSWVKAKKELYRYFREKYPELSSHYIHEAIRDASTRLKSFLKLKKKGLAYTDKPEVKQWSVGCDNQLWKLTLQGVSLATHIGWVNIPLLLHKQFYRYYNTGWVLRSSCRWKLENGKLKLYVVFSKSAKQKGNYSKAIGVDVNENNVTLFILLDNKAVTVVTNHSRIVLGYAYRRRAIQLRYRNNSRTLRKALMKLREADVKKDLRNKVASFVVKIASAENAVVVLEKLPKRFQDRALEKNGLKSLDAHRLKQSAIRGIQKQIVEKALEHGVRVELVDPRGTSRLCPVCGSSLAPVTGNAQRRGWSPRFMKCTKCGFTHDRDVIGAWNIALKLNVSPVPLGSKGVHDLHVEWLVATMKRGEETQPVPEKPTET